MVMVVVVIVSTIASITRSSFIRHVMLGIAFLAMVLVPGLRDASVGTDTSNYVGYFERIRTFADVARLGVETQEYGFWVITWLVHFISDQYVALFITIAVIVISCYQYVIVTYSRNITVSFFLLFTSGVYTFFFNGARQGVACAIYSLTIGPLLKHKLLQYLTLVIVASLFHKTAIGMLPLYFIFNRPNNFRGNMIIAALGIVTSIFFKGIIGTASNVLDPRYSGYAAQEASGGYFVVGLDVVFLMFFVFFKKHVAEYREEYDRYLNMLFFGTMIGVVSSVAGVDPSGFLRFAFYSSLSTVLLWPIVFKNMPERLPKFVVGFVFIFGFIILYTLETIRFSNLTSFRFNTSLGF